MGGRDNPEIHARRAGIPLELADDYLAQRGRGKRKQRRGPSIASQMTCPRDHDNRSARFAMRAFGGLRQPRVAQALNINHGGQHLWRHGVTMGCPLQPYLRGLLLWGQGGGQAKSCGIRSKGCGWVQPEQGARLFPWQGGWV